MPRKPGRSTGKKPGSSSRKKTTRTKAKARPKAKAKTKARPGTSSRIPSWPETVPAVTVPVDTGVYPLEVIFGAAYVLMDRAYVHLAPAGGRAVDVRLAGKEPLDDRGLRNLGGEFANELVNQSLRATLDESGRKLREYIVAKALFFHKDGPSTVQRILESTMQEAFDEDPLDIAVPWEEKYGGGKEGT